MPGFGAIQYDARADLNGSSFINSDDSLYSRATQNSIVFPRRQTILGQNLAKPQDSNDDGQVTALDALVVINAINRTMGGAPLVDPNAYSMDVSGDGVLTPLDALLIINLLNQPAGTSAGEGEGQANQMLLDQELPYTSGPDSDADDLMELLASDWISEHKKRQRN